MEAFIMAAPLSVSKGVIGRRALLGASLALSGALLLPGCATSKRRTLGLSTTKEGYQNFFDVAGQADTPYDVRYAILPFDLSLQAISSGDLDAGSNFTDIPLTIWGGSLKDCRIVALIRSDAQSRLLGLVARDGLGARSPADLKGRRVGYLRSSNYHYYLLQLLEQQGLGWDDITPVSLPRDTLPAAFASGQLDFWITQGIETILAQRRYGGKLITQASGDYAGNGVVIANRKALDDPDRFRDLGDYLLRFRKVIDWMESNDAAWAAILAKATGIDQSYYLDWRRQKKTPNRLVAIDDKAIADQQGAADLFRRFGVAQGSFDAKPLWDRRFDALLSQAKP
jgi:sulfonate transport system substrate-binding protein